MTEPTKTRHRTAQHRNSVTPAMTRLTHSSHSAAAAPESSPSASAAALLEVHLFGPLRVYWRPEPRHDDDGASRVNITTALNPRSRELLALLAVHPDGISRDHLIDTLWTERPPCRPANALANLFGRLRTALAHATNGQISEVVRGDRTRYQLCTDRATVDFILFVNAVRERRNAVTEDAREVTYHRIIQVARSGTLAADLNTDWIAPLREAVRRDAISAVGSLAAILVNRDPRQALELLESTLDLDPYNELIYRDLMLLHAKLGECHVINHTLSLLTQRLAEINDKPSPEILELARHLREKIW